jgi:hypothetical protein
MCTLRNEVARDGEAQGSVEFPTFLALISSPYGFKNALLHLVSSNRI